MTKKHIICCCFKDVENDFKFEWHANILVLVWTWHLLESNGWQNLTLLNNKLMFYSSLNKKMIKKQTELMKHTKWRSKVKVVLEYKDWQAKGSCKSLCGWNLVKKREISMPTKLVFCNQLQLVIDLEEPKFVGRVLLFWSRASWQKNAFAVWRFQLARTSKIFNFFFISIQVLI